MLVKSHTINISGILRLTLFGVLILLLSPTYAFAHDEDSVFVPTIAIDEPTVGDELDIVYSSNKNKNEDEALIHSRAFGMEISKVIFPHFGLSLGTNYQRLRLEDRFNSGNDNIEVGAKYEFYVNPCQNLLLSLGLVAELGKTGSRKVGSESATSLSPVLYFGKGMQNLNDELKYLQPIVFTGLVSPSYCTKASKIENIDIGFSFQYHLRHLNHEEGCSSSSLLNNIIPVVELPLSVCTTKECRGKVAGTINPGILFSGPYVQLGIEATLPISKKSGRHVGALAQVHFFLDNIFKGF